MKNWLGLVILVQTLFVLSCATTLQQKPVVGLEQVKKDTAELILDHKYFVIAYDKDHNIAKWVKYTLTKEDFEGLQNAPSLINTPVQG